MEETTRKGSAGGSAGLNGSTYGNWNCYFFTSFMDSMQVSVSVNCLPLSYMSPSQMSLCAATLSLDKKFLIHLHQGQGQYFILRPILGILLLRGCVLP